MSTASSSARVYDVIVVGGSFAGLAAATSLARVLKHVLVLDSAKPRNLTVPHTHNVLGHDNRLPTEILELARTQYLAYEPYAQLTRATVSEVTPIGKEGKPRFRVTTTEGQSLEARRVVLAMGVRDELPPIKGLQELWGVGVVHCPHCSGFELRGKSLGVIHNLSFPFAAIYAAMVAELASSKTYFLNGKTISDTETKQLEGLGYTIEPAAIASLRGDDASRQIRDVLLEDGRSVDLDGVFFSPTTQLPALVQQLGLATDVCPFGPMVKTDPTRKETSVPGIFAAGDMARAQHQVTFAMADGLAAAIFCHMSLLTERQ